MRGMLRTNADNTLQANKEKGRSLGSSTTVQVRYEC